MRKTWSFKVEGHSIKIVNSWFHGMKLHIDGDLRDYDRSLLACGNWFIGQFRNRAKIAMLKWSPD
ncbi:hypothetical protein GCM10011357_01330 [Lacimicrobium alkaliphilum]|uniref:Transposase n=1 Tax=Lacimicrobium alkaliphilum TaxID=1526571 RepID=A0ABQ1QZL2_9ALTE|nr:hypothetical protein GCM10011357_01330 [Lacimicrobium alkaliphilum]